MIERTALDSTKEFCYKWVAMAKERVLKNQEEQQQLTLQQNISDGKARAKKSKKDKKDKKKSKRSKREEEAKLGGISKTLPISSSASSSLPTTSLLSSASPRMSTSLHPLQKPQHQPQIAALQLPPPFQNLSPSTIFYSLLATLFFVFIALMLLSSRISNLQSQVQTYSNTNSELNSQVQFLHTFIKVISENITGLKDGDIYTHWNYWKMNTKLLDTETKILEWTQRIQRLKEEITDSNHWLEKNVLEAVFQQHLQTVEPSGSSWVFIGFTLLAMILASLWILHRNQMLPSLRG